MLSFLLIKHDDDDDTDSLYIPDILTNFTEVAQQRSVRRL